MSRRESSVDNIGYIDAEYSSGDSNRQNNKQHYQEENNNEVNELSKELSEMGCIVDAVKKPPNICVETCVYDQETEEKKPQAEDGAYSDEFEEDSDDESIKSVKMQPMMSASNTSSSQPIPSSLKLSKSQSSMSRKAPASISGRSTDYGSFSVPSTRRINMSFTNERLREIERHNHILLTKILSARNTKKSSIPTREQPARRPMPSAAVTRKNQQRQIDRDNMILLKKIQRAKSSVPTLRR